MSDPIFGFAFPFRIVVGGVATESGIRKLNDNIAHLLLTTVGERVMLRDYGGGLRQLLHDPNNNAMRAIVQRQVAKAIGAYEPRVLVQVVNLTQDEPGGVLNINVQYIVRQTSQVQTMSVPVDVSGL
jgi:phage baseplate assembly protein W